MTGPELQLALALSPCLGREGAVTAQRGVGWGSATGCPPPQQRCSIFCWGAPQPTPGVPGAMGEGSRWGAGPNLLCSHLVCLGHEQPFDAEDKEKVLS